jgi:hypothetical protein
MVGVFFFLTVPLLNATENECARGEKLFEERTKIIANLHKMGQQPTPQEVCSKVTSLIQNGNALLTWTQKEKEWCRIPDELVERLTADHKQSSMLQKKACDAAKAPAQPKMPLLGDASSSSQQPDDKRQLTRPIPVPQEIPPLK